jgi:hypothetical protein
MTWHWTATYDLAECRALLGGAAALRKGCGSAHFAIGRSFSEGFDQYVSLDNRSWHAGLNQLVRWDGRPSDSHTTASRTAIGIEMVNIGHERSGVPASSDWIRVASVDSRTIHRVQPFTSEQIAMAIYIGKHIRERWPAIGPRDHHGHHDICPRYKLDVIGFPFAEVLRGIYDDQSIPDVWTPFCFPFMRKRALRLAMPTSDVGETSNDPYDEAWTEEDDSTLMKFQEQHGLAVTGSWNTFVGWTLFNVLGARFDRLG